MCCCVAAFGMNVGGVPWTKQTDPTLVHGFRNVLIICAVIVMLLLAGFGVVPLYTYLVTRHKHQAVKAKWLSSKRSVRYRGSLRYPAYLRLWVHLVAVRLFWVSRSDIVLYWLLEAYLCTLRFKCVSLWNISSSLLGSS